MGRAIKGERPVALKVLPENVPEELKADTTWVCWKYEDVGGRWDTVLISPRDGIQLNKEAAFIDACGFDGAVAAYSRMVLDGIGFVRYENDALCVVGLDDSYVPNEGKLQGWASEIIDEVRSYAELSHSGTGTQIFVFGKPPEGGERLGNVEVSGDSRLVPVTGHHLTGTPAGLLGCETEIRHLCADMRNARAMTDDDVIRRATQADDSEKFRLLWEDGSFSSYFSSGEADEALCSLLGFWTRGDHERVKRLFQRSALATKPEWHSRSDAYLDKTVRKAMASLFRMFKPPTQRPGLTKKNQSDQSIQEHSEDAGMNTAGGPREVVPHQEADEQERGQPDDGLNPAPSDWRTLSDEEMGQAQEMALDLAETIRELSIYEGSFKLARRLLQLTGGPPEQFRGVVCDLCEMTEHPFEEFFGYFLDVWGKPRTPENQDALQFAFQKAKAEPYPPALAFGSKVFLLVASTAWHLSRLTRGKPFQLPVKRLAELCECSAMLISKATSFLKKRGIIVEVQKDGLKGNYSYSQGKAKDYRFIGKGPT